jgi:kynurenine formamidase
MTLPSSVIEFIERAEMYDLGLTLEPGMPHGDAHSPFLYSLIKGHGQVRYRGGTSSATDMFTMGTHVGTHVDAVGHVSRDGRIHGDCAIAEKQSYLGGLAVGGIDAQSPFVCRGVLIDVPRIRGREVCEPSDVVGVDDLVRGYEMAGGAVRPGDAVLIRTGWVQHWPDRSSYFANPSPGVGLEAAEWLGDNRVAVAGTDTFAFESVPASGLPVHVRMLVDYGIPIIEMLDLEALAADGVTSFLFAALPLKLKGGTGSPVRPVAIAEVP